MSQHFYGNYSKASFSTYLLCFFGPSQLLLKQNTIAMVSVWWSEINIILWCCSLSCTAGQKIKKKSRQKNSWNQINQIFFSWNCIFGSFPSSKIDFWPFLKSQKMEFAQKIIREIDLFDFTSFFLPGLFKIFWPTVLVSARRCVKDV